MVRGRSRRQLGALEPGGPYRLRDDALARLWPAVRRVRRTRDPRLDTSDAGPRDERTSSRAPASSSCCTSATTPTLSRSQRLRSCHLVSVRPTSAGYSSRITCPAAVPLGRRRRGCRARAPGRSRECAVGYSQARQSARIIPHRSFSEPSQSAFESCPFLNSLRLQRQNRQRTRAGHRTFLSGWPVWRGRRDVLD